VNTYSSTVILHGV